MSKKETKRYRSIKQIREAFISGHQYLSPIGTDDDELNRMDKFAIRISDVLSSNIPDEVNHKVDK